MTKGNELRREIKDSGVSIVALARKVGCSRNRVYAIIDGADCTANEITAISEALHFSKDKRDYIFLGCEVN